MTGFEKERLPEGWIQTTIKNIVEEVKKINPKEMPNQLFYYCDINSIDNSQFIITTPRQFLGKNAPSRARQLIKHGDILFSTVRTYLKNIAIVPSDLNKQLASTGFCVLRPKQNIYNKFVFNYVQFDDFLKSLNSKQRGTSYPAVRNADVLDTMISLPPLSEQHRIVSKIESIFAQIDACKSRLERLVPQASSAPDSLARLKNSVLKQAFEGKLVSQNPSDESVEELLMRIGKNTGKNVMFEKEGLPEGWISIKFENITPYSQSFNPVTEKNQKYVGLEHIEKDTGKIIGHADSNMTLSTKTVFSKGDLLYGKLRPYLNKVAIAEFNGVCSTDILVFPKNPFIINNLLKFYLLKSDFVRFANNTMTGVQHPRTSHKKLANYSLHIPPLQEQHRIVQKIESIFARINAVDKQVKLSLKLLDMLKSSTLKQAFEGRLVPQDPNDEPDYKLLESIRCVNNVK